NVGTNSSTYTPPTGAAGTLYYRVVVTSNGVNVTSNNYATVTVYAQLVVGAVASSQTINFDARASALIVNGVCGGNNSYSYQWQSSSLISFSSPTNVGTNTTTYTPLTNTADVLYYRVGVTSNGATVYSNYVTIQVYSDLKPGTLTPTLLTVNYSDDPGPI